MTIDDIGKADVHGKAHDHSATQNQPSKIFTATAGLLKTDESAYLRKNTPQNPGNQCLTAQRPPLSSQN